MPWARLPPLDRRDWLPELRTLLLAAALTTVTFAVTPLDIAAARLLYRPNASDPWPLAKRPWGAALYGAAPWVTASLVLVALAMLAVALSRRHDRLRREAVFLLLAVVVGPGLLVNAVFKDHWHRPRPRDVVELGGSLAYVPAPLRGSGEGGGSFPCGHCSVGFLYGAGWWLWKERHRARARVSLGAGILAGSALGVGRMAAGGHFLSDVVWSALLAFGVAHTIWHYVLRVPAHERLALAGAPPAELPRRLEQALALGAALGGVGVLVALFATPHGTPIEARLVLSRWSPAPRAFELVARHAEVELDLVDAPADVITIDGELHGFGLPNSRLETRTEIAPGSPSLLRYRLVQRGWFTDLDAVAHVELPASAITRVRVRLEQGNIRVSDHTRAQVLRGGGVALDLATGAGTVESPPRS